MPIPILQGTLDLMILRTLATMGPRHAHGIASRLEEETARSPQMSGVVEKLLAEEQ